MKEEQIEEDSSSKVTFIQTQSQEVEGAPGEISEAKRPRVGPESLSNSYGSPAATPEAAPRLSEPLCGDC